MRKQRSEITAVVGLVALGIVGTAGFLLWPDRPDPQLLAWDDTATVVRGHAVYERACSTCHGALEGDAPANGPPPEDRKAPPHGADGHTWQHPDFALFQLTKSGEVADLCQTLDTAGMPQFGNNLSDHQIVDVLSYIKSTWPVHIRAEHDSVNALYAAQNAAYRALLYPSDF